MADDALLMGAVAYDPKVVTIWDGFRRWFDGQGLAFDYVLYSNYERQVEDLLAGRIHAAWNSPLAWVRARRLAEAPGVGVRALAMRDTDRDLTSVVVVRADSPITEVGRPAGQDRRHRRGRLAPGHAAPARPPARLRPGAGADFEVRRFDVGVGLHGDHIGGERDAAARPGRRRGRRRLHDRRQPPALHPGGDPAGRRDPDPRPDRPLRPLQHDRARDAGPADAVEPVRRLLLAMDYGDPEVRPLLDLEGLKQWQAGRTTGYAAAGGGGRRPRLLRREGGDHRCRLSTLRTSASTRAPTSWSTGPWPRWPRAAGSTVPGRDPHLAVHLPAWARAQGHRSIGRRPDAVDVEGHRSEAARRLAPAGRARPGRAGRGRRRRRPGPGHLGPGGARRPGRGRRAAAAPGRPRRHGPRSGPTSPPSSTPRPLPASGTRPRPSTGTPPSSSRRRGRGRRRPGHDLPGRERAGRPRRPGPLPRPDPPPLPGGRAVPRRPGRRRGPPRRGLHPPGRAARRPARHVGRRRPGVAADPARRARLLARRLPAVGARRGHVPRPALASSSATPPTRSPAQVAHLALPDEARHVAFGDGPPRAPDRRPTRASAAGCGPPSSAATTPWPRRPGSTPTSSTPWSCWPPATWAPAAHRRRLGPGRSRSRPRWTRAGAAGSPGSASRPARRPSCPRCTPATSCDRQVTRPAGTNSDEAPIRPFARP